jgi:uncharacterized membrane protein YeaQ/YmgE (transglycosylase-associated protein family)
MSLWDIIYMLVFGLVVGAIARFLMPGRDPMGWLSTALLGIAGSFLGTLAKSFLMPRSGAAGWILSVIGALVVLAAYRYISGQRA